MARPVVHGQQLRPLLLAVVCCLLLPHVSECSRPSPWLGDDHVADDAPHHHHQLLILDAEARTAGPPASTEEVAAGDGRTGGGAAAAAADAAPSSPASATAPARAVGTVASRWPRQASDRAALVVRAGMMLPRSKLARRFLAGAPGVEDEAGSATDGSGASCHSYNPHTNCPPAGKP